MTSKNRKVLSILCVGFILLYSLTSCVGEKKDSGEPEPITDLPASYIPRMETLELASLIGNPDVVIIDSDDQESHWVDRKETIKGAVILGPAYFEPMDDFMEVYSKDKAYVIYCGCENENTSASLAQTLKENGYENVFALKGGWHQWSKLEDKETFQTDPLPPNFNYKAYMAALTAAEEVEECEVYFLDGKLVSDCE